MLMVLKEIIKIKLLDLELHKGNTGNSKLLARKIGVSRSTLYNLFEELKEVGAIIGYDNKNNTYYYIKEINIVFEIKYGSDLCMNFSELRNLLGG